MRIPSGSKAGMENPTEITVRDIIKRLGGPRVVAQALGLKPGAVYNYPLYGVFPPATYLTLSALAKAKGFTIPTHLFRVLTREDKANGTPAQK